MLDSLDQELRTGRLSTGAGAPAASEQPVPKQVTMANIIQLTRGAEYAMCAISHIASHPPESIVSTDSIAATTAIPRSFASNVLGALTRAGLLCAHRGSCRGYSLARPASQISVLEVIEAYDGPFVKPWCLMDSTRNCSSDDPCELHDACQLLATQAHEALTGITVADLASRPRSFHLPTAPNKEDPL